MSEQKKLEIKKIIPELSKEQKRRYLVIAGIIVVALVVMLVFFSNNLFGGFLLETKMDQSTFLTLTIIFVSASTIIISLTVVFLIHYIFFPEERNKSRTVVIKFNETSKEN